MRPQTACVESAVGGTAPWRSSLARNRYDRSEVLTPAEQEALQILVLSRYRWGGTKRAGMVAMQNALSRLLEPLRDATSLIPGDPPSQDGAAAYLLRVCQRQQAAYWGWPPAVWGRVLGHSQAAFFQEHGTAVDGEVRQQMMAVAYLLGCFRDVSVLGDYKREELAVKVFGRALVTAALEPVRALLVTWGYARAEGVAVRSAMCELMLRNQDPAPQAMTAERLEEFRQQTTVVRRSHVLQIGKALAYLGFLDQPLGIANHDAVASTERPIAQEEDMHPEWLAWAQRWERTSTLTAGTRRSNRIALCKAGRWLYTHHPEIHHPEQWDRDLAARYVAAVDRMQVLDYASADGKGKSRKGQPLSARTKHAYLGALRVFFRDCQEWGWIPRRFDPARVFATPRSVKALIGPAPRTIAADLWAKLLWAGLNLTTDDLASDGVAPNYYPVELVRALAVVWLFAGLRSDEIVRLRVGCVRWPDEVAAPDVAQASLAGICSLDIPVNKTGTAFSKPVDRAVGEAILAWEHVRPVQPPLVDRKTGERTPVLFCYRARPVRREYINHALIPTLCRKAGMPTSDARGSLTSHRARATIASQLFNTRKPLTLSELQAWLGHRSPVTTQNYVALAPTRLARAYADAGYFARNLRTIEVLIDQDAIMNAAGAEGAIWRYYDLGHGLCSYEFFDQCPHRMACPRCDFYNPKDSGRAQLLEAKSNLLRLLQEVPLTEEERASVDGDLAALDRLTVRLAEQPTPSGQTPNELNACPPCRS
jgi:integrase